MTRLAFLITAHNDPLHLKRLTDALPQNAEFFVHVDAKSDIDAFKGIDYNSRVHFSEKRINVMWGSYSQMESEITILKEALDYPVHFDYYITMSGLDYPLWSNNRMEEFFETHKGEEFIQGVCLESQPDGSKLYRQHRPFNYKYFKYGSLGSKCRVALREIIYALGFRKPLHFQAQGKDYKVFKGSSWWAITDSLAKTVLDYWENNDEYRNFFHDFFGPDETFVPTIVFNTDFKAKALNSPKVLNRLEDVTPLTFIDYTNGIKILDESDLSRLLASGKMFCRKAITGQSDKLMDLIDSYREKS